MLNQQQQLIKVLQQEIAHIKRLMLSLDLEQAALSENEITTLNDIVETNQKQITELEILGNQREQLLDAMRQQSGFTLDNIDQIDCDPELVALWTEFVALAEQCRDKNRANGSIVESASRQSRDALAVLQGVSPIEENTSRVYDNSGYTNNSRGKRTISHV